MGNNHPPLTTADPLKKLFPFLTEEEEVLVKPHMEVTLIRSPSFCFSSEVLQDKIFLIPTGKVDLFLGNYMLHSSNDGVCFEGNLIPYARKSILTMRIPQETILVSCSPLHLESALPPALYAKLNGDLEQKKNTFIRGGFSKILGLLLQNLEDGKFRDIVSRFIFFILMAICFFFVSLKVLDLLPIHTRISSFYSIPLIAGLAVFAICFIKSSHLPLSFFGITLKNTKRSILDAFQYSFYMMLFILLLKLFCIKFIPIFKPESLFHYATLITEHLSHADWYALTIGYSIMAIFQELIVRGCLQNGFEAFLEHTKHKKLSAILLSNMLFATLHLQLSLEIAVAAFLVGIFWGWLYQRTRNLIGVCISHILIGIWGGIFIGYLNK